MNATVFYQWPVSYFTLVPVISSYIRVYSTEYIVPIFCASVALPMALYKYVL